MPARSAFTYIRESRERDRSLHRGNQPPSFRNLCIRLWGTRRLPSCLSASGSHRRNPQNGNAYEEGLSEGWNPIRAYWQEQSPAKREALRSLLTPETTYWQYTHGVPDVTAISPDGYSLDNFYLARPGADEIQLDLFGDYNSNVALYPTFQDCFRTHKPRFLAAMGKERSFFPAAGAEAFRRDIPDAIVLFFDTGHFALETHAKEIAAVIRGFFAR
jgi:pimeloyl-ACP methyl ester carboxylesterase